MSLEIFIILFIIYITPSTTRSTSGMHFVVAVPKIEENKPSYAFLHITTELEYVTVWVSTPESYGSRTLRTKSHVIFRNVFTHVKIPPNTIIPRSGIFSSTFLKSSGPVRVWAELASTGYVSSDFFTLIPRMSSYLTYFVTTATGKAFIMVLSFELPTQLNIEFPKYIKHFEITCYDNQICAPGSTVYVPLKDHQVWFLVSRDLKSDFQNTRITSDQPIFVVSGNTVCANNFLPNSEVFKTNAVDLCASSMKPVSTWGKTYVVPNNYHEFGTDTQHFRFNFMKAALTVQFWQTFENGTVAGTDKTFTNKDNTVYHCRRHHGSLVVTAEVPFGMYQLFESASRQDSLHDSSLMSLIPVEQWLSGTYWVDLRIGIKFVYRYYIVAVGDTNTIQLLDTKKTIKWDKGSEVKGNQYFQSIVDLSGMKTRIYSNGTSRFVVYIQVFSKKSGITHATMMTVPQEFFQSKINDILELCEVTSPIADDRLDNDCDGFVDEESLNGKDDDGDGSVDEDFVDNYNDGKWSQWFLQCNLNCSDQSYEVESRFCTDKSKFGKDCVGQSIRCNKQTCPEDCSQRNDDHTSCYCGNHGGCEMCTKGFFICDSCKPGLVPSKTCSSECPEHWGGVGCTELLNAGLWKSLQEGNMKSLFIYSCLVAIIGGIVIGTILYVRQQTEEDEEYTSPSQNDDLSDIEGLTASSHSTFQNGGGEREFRTAQDYRTSDWNDWNLSEYSFTQLQYKG